MEARIAVTGNLVNDAQVKVKASDKSEYLLLTVGVNKPKGGVDFYTAFAYGVSEARAKLLTKGSLVYVYGTYQDEITENPNTKEKQISRIINVKDSEIIFSKKHDE